MHSFLTPSIETLFVLRLNVPVTNFSVMSGRSYRFLGILKVVLWVVNVPYSRTQHGVASADRTHGV